MLRPLRLVLFLAVGALLGPGLAVAATIAIDSFTDELPPNACLPNSSQRVVFFGTFCDGASCPPDPVAGPCGGSSFASQDGLAGVLGSVERAVSVGPVAAGTVARIVPGRLDVSVPVSGGIDGIFLNYSPAESDWGLDLYGMGVTAFRVPLDGVITPARPLVLRIVMSDFGDDVLPGGYAEIDVNVTSPGDAVVALTSFSVSTDFDFRSVDAISFHVSECGNSSCLGDPRPDRAFAVGPLQLDIGGPTPARLASWGGVKIRYR